MNEFDRVLAEGAALQRALPSLELVAVGGTAAAVHCGHRHSTDVDSVSAFLRDRFQEVREELNHLEGWRTNRLSPPVLILDERHGVELGIRQLRRAAPLESEVDPASGLCVPTASEALRVKAWLLAERNATRDFIDVAALGDLLGETAALGALGSLNSFYPPLGNQTPLTRFAEACEAGQPGDLAAVDPANYKGVRPPYDRWDYVASRCRRLGRAALRRELEAPGEAAGPAVA